MKTFATVVLQNYCVKRGRESLSASLVPLPAVAICLHILWLQSVCTTQFKGGHISNETLKFFFRKQKERKKERERKQQQLMPH